MGLPGKVDWNWQSWVLVSAILVFHSLRDSNLSSKISYKICLAAAFFTAIRRRKE